MEFKILSENFQISELENFYSLQCFVVYQKYENVLNEYTLVFDKQKLDTDVHNIYVYKQHLQILDFIKQAYYFEIIIESKKKLCKIISTHNQPKPCIFLSEISNGATSDSNLLISSFSNLVLKDKYKDIK